LFVFSCRNEMKPFFHSLVHLDSRHFIGVKMNALPMKMKAIGSSLLLSRSCMKMKLNLARRSVSGLKNQSLWRTSGFVNGKFQPVAATTPKFDVFNPADGSVIASLPRMNAADTNDACTVASTAFNSWKKTTGLERSKLLRRMADLMLENIDDLALIMTLESGKPMAEARGEVLYAHSFYEWYAEEAKRFAGEVIQPPVKGRRMLAIKQAVGPAGLITPWNFPSAMITRKVGPALAAGCTVVIKPSEETPMSALALCAIAEQAGVPAGVINCLTVAREEVKDVGEALCHSELLRKVEYCNLGRVSTVC
jgi:succinate-semialdehyde dehydrogenase/glutarate-semialdehyde dehydrogenase